MVVQPTCEILFLQQNFPALFNLLPFTELLQAGRVSCLKLSRKSVLRGRALGLSTEEMLSRLARYHQHGEVAHLVPYVLSDFSSTTVERVSLIEVSSEAAAEVLSRQTQLHARRLAPCLVAVPPDEFTLREVWSVCEREGIDVRQVAPPP